MLLAGDVGATKTRVGVFSAEAGPRAPLATATLVSADYSSLEALLRTFLERMDHAVRRASLGVPGPVVDGRVKTTNLPWEVDERNLATALALESVTLFNDLVAVAYAIPHLTAGELHLISPGTRVARGTFAVVAPGTGLGEAYATWNPDGYTAHASEGGHADFAPVSELQEALLAFLRRRYGHVSYERVCSGIGLPNLYAFLRETGAEEEPEWLAAEMRSVEDPAPVILRAALDPERPSALCRRTLELFVSILGAKAGNLALTTLATGGVFVGGGIPPRILPALSDGAFAAAFHRKGRLASLVEQIPVYVIRNPEAAFLGAACHGLRKT